MWAILDDQDNFKITKNPINVKTNDGDVITDLRLVGKSELKNKKIYEFVVDNNKLIYQNISKINYIIDHHYGTVEEEKVCNYPNLDNLKQRRIKEINNQCYQILSKTDYKVIRALEKNSSLEKDWSDYRTNVRNTCEQAKTDINNLTEANEVANYQVTWPKPPNE